MKDKDLLKKKWFLYITEFFAGMSVMAVELGASRLMAPYFSSSQIIWTIIIGTIMIAMAMGNVWGGRVSDKDPNPAKLYIRILIAAVWIAAIPVVGKYLIIGVSLGLAIFIQHNFLVWASFFTCFLLFVFPLMLLGTVTPSLVKFTVTSLDDNGKTVGELGALNTIGSIIGTFIPTFISIPAVGTSATFEIFAVILASIGVYYFIRMGQYKKCVITVCCIGLCMGLSQISGFAFWQKDVVYEGESVYNYLLVKEDKESVSLSTNVLFGVQSIMMKEKEQTGMYYDYALAAPLMAGMSEKEKGNILILGMGTGTYATLCDRYFPNSMITGVEIDAKIAELSKKYFELSSNIQLEVGDGRAYLRQNNKKKYDVIMIDAYQDITIPFHMSTVEFFQIVKEHLNENGIMVVNMNMRSQKDGTINDYLCDTISKEFENVYEINVENSSNKEVFATSSSKSIEELNENINQLTDINLEDMMVMVGGNLHKRVPGNQILTDDKAPVELLGMKVLDEMISDEIEYYREIYMH